MTYNQLIERTKGAAAGLQKLGVCKDDVICVMSPNHMDYLVACYASAVIYATFQPINPLYTAGNLEVILISTNKAWSHWSYDALRWCHFGASYDIVEHRRDHRTTSYDIVTIVRWKIIF